MLRTIIPQLMKTIEGSIYNSSVIAWVVMVVSFLVLAKSADLFVNSSVSVADRFHIPKLVIGLVLVSFATTAPELCVSLTATFQGNSEMALGNAVGSVICNTGLALGVAGIIAPSAIRVLPKILKTSGSFLFGISILCFLFIMKDYTLSRFEGAVLITIFFIYLAYMFREYKNGNISSSPGSEAEVPENLKKSHMPLIITFFIISLTGILIASEFIVISATSIAESLHIPKAVIALTLVALGTSVPEVATSLTAARKGFGEIAIGNILGANILNICWVAGASALVNNLQLTQREMYFMFPAMFIMIAAMLIVLRTHYRLTKKEGIILVALYLIYITGTMIFFAPGG